MNTVSSKPIPPKDPLPAYDLSIVIVSFNTCELTHQCLTQVARYSHGLQCETFVVDNASTDGSADMVAREFPWVRLIRLKKNRGFAGGNNAALRHARGRYLLLLNSDAFLAPGVLAKTMAYMARHPGIGILGCKLTDPDGRLQPSARSLPNALNKILHITGLAGRFPRSRFFGRVDYSWWDHATPRSVGWVVGAFFLIRRQAMSQIGLLDERYFLYFEEIDYCLAAHRKGWQVVFFPDAAVVHLGGQSAVRSGHRVSTKGRQMITIRLTSEYRYYRKWYGLAHVVTAALIEAGWHALIWLRHRLRPKNHSAERCQAADLMIRLIGRTLISDNWGRGRSKPCSQNAIHGRPDHV